MAVVSVLYEQICCLKYFSKHYSRTHHIQRKVSYTDKNEIPFPILHNTYTRIIHVGIIIPTYLNIKVLYINFI